MSEIEYNVGVLKPVYMLNGIEATAKRIMCFEKWTKTCDTWLASLEDEGYKRYICTKTQIYKVIDNIQMDIDDLICEAAKNLDGTIKYAVRFYNGTTAFDEAVLLALDKNTEQKQEQEQEQDSVCLQACKAAYRKHVNGDDTIGWEELSTLLYDALCIKMGDDGFVKWNENNKNL